MSEHLDRLRTRLSQCTPEADKYAKGMTTRDIQSHVLKFYGLDVSASLVSQITDKIIDLDKQWHNRPLEPVYPIVFFDAIHYKLISEGKVTN
jgi:transposase-like protein